MGFFELESSNANSMSKVILSLREELNIENKIISQIYDGAITMSGKFSGIQKQIKTVELEGEYIHCVAHRVNLVLKDLVKNIEPLQEIYKTLRQFSAFFSHSFKKTKTLKNFEMNLVPSFAEIRWNYLYSIISYVVQNKKKLIELFKEFLENKTFTQKDKESSTNFLNFLNCNKK